nr:AMP-binding protein [Ilumatobacteraceae bacterium]
MNQQRSPSLLPSLRGELGDRADAVCVAGEPVSWATLSAMANGTAARLLGARAVAIDARPTLQTVIAVAAGLAAGVAVVPVPPDAGPVERSHIIRDSGAEAVVGAADWPDVALARIEL